MKRLNLKGTISLGALCKKGSILDIIGYFDANWAGFKKDKRYINGYNVFFFKKSCYMEE